MQAADLFRRGVIRAEIARRLGVSHQNRVRVAQGVATGWPSCLALGWTCGRPRKLTQAQLATVEHALARGAEANGYATDVWTLPRVAEVIQRLTGVSYHPGHVWYLLRNQLDWTWQRPARRAVERNEEAIEQWVEKRWPQLKNTHGARRRHRAS